MVKENYVAPQTEVRKSSLRASILAGSQTVVKAHDMGFDGGVVNGQSVSTARARANMNID